MLDALGNSIDLNRGSAPEATTLLKFRHLLEVNGLTHKIFNAVNGHLDEKGWMTCTGPSSMRLEYGGGLEDEPRRDESEMLGVSPRMRKIFPMHEGRHRRARSPATSG